MANTIGAVAINGRNFSTYLDVLMADSAIIAGTAASGGEVINNVDFRAHKFVSAQDDGLPTVVAEGDAKPAADAVLNVVDLDVLMWAKFRQITDQMEETTDPADLASSIVNTAVPGFPIAFDARYFAAAHGGANKNTDVEYDASDPVASVSTWLAGYDETSHGPGFVALNRAGARKLQYALDANNRLQAPVVGGIAGITGLPTFLTGCTGAQMGTTVPAGAILGAIVPTGSKVAVNRNVRVTPMPQATINSVGPEQNIVNYKIESAMGYANGVDHDATGRGWTFLIDAA